MAIISDWMAGKMRKIIFSLVLFYGLLGNYSSSYSLEQNNLEIEAKQLYENQQYELAIDTLKRAIERYQRLQNIVEEINARRNLALLYQKTGNWQQGKQEIESNLKVINNLKDEKLKQELTAGTLEVLAQIHLESGEIQQAIASGEKIVKLYQQLGNKSQENKSKINLAIALKSLGLYNQAQINLLEVKDNLQEESSKIQIATLLELGNIFTKIGNLSEANTSLQESLKLAREVENREQIAQILISFGDLERIRKDPAKAINYYQEALEVTDNLQTRTTSKLKQLSIYIDRYEWQETLSREIERDLEKLPVSHSKIYAEIYLAEGMIRYLQTDPILDYNLNERADRILSKTITQATAIGDRRAKSYANGTLGYLYEQNNRDREAKILTEKALLEASLLNAPELSYQWQWQLGRLAKKLGETQTAISAYSQAVNNLQSLRGDLVAISDEVQFTFSQKVEPVYRELVDLLLASNNPSQENLQQARETIEQLQLARLNNYFREACLDAVPQEIDGIDQEASVIYSILLPDRLALILSIPGQPLSYQPSFFQETTAAQIENIVENLYSDLDFFDPDLGYDRQPYQELYNLLIRPISSNLENSQVKTLVFVLDGILQGVPVAALFDGEQYLIEKYNVVLTPGLQLLKSPSLSPQRLRTIFAGISEARDGFSALPGVQEEGERIAELVPAQVLLDRDFTSEALRNQIGSRPFPIVHLATHGEFSSSAEDTFLLAWDRRINVKELDIILGSRNRQRENPIELLILSACETARGDDRAALGIAGVAMRSGARTTIASLWAVQDDSTTLLMKQLYSQLNQPGINKAEALRQAQLSLLKDSQFKEPYFWSAFVLIGNWI